jgi:DNA mismatch repair ATPase MutS
MIEMYGIKTAKLCGLPLEVIEEAEQIYRRLTHQVDTTPVVDDKDVSSTGSRGLIHQLLALHHSALDDTGMLHTPHPQRVFLYFFD